MRMEIDPHIRKPDFKLGLNFITKKRNLPETRTGLIKFLKMETRGSF